MNLAELRQEYPEYDDLSDEQLAKGFHKTYYADLDYYDFSQRLGFEPPETIYEPTPPMGISPPEYDVGLTAPAEMPEDRHKVPQEPQSITPGIQEPDFMGEATGDLSNLTIDSPTGKALMKTAAGMLFGEGLPEGLGYLQKPLETALDHWSKYFMTPEDEQAMQAKHPNLMAARYAATSLLLPGVSEKLASPEEMATFAKKSPEEQRVEILGLAAGYAVFGATAAGAKALLAKAAEHYPWLTKPIGKWIAESNWYRQLTNRERGLVVQSMDDAIRGMESAGMGEAQILREIRKRGGAEAAYHRFAREQKISPEAAYKPPEEFAGPKFRPGPEPKPAELPGPAAQIPYQGEKPIILTGKNPGRGVIIHKSTKDPGKYQMTHWDHKGFISDSAFKTRAEAVEEARIDFKFTKLNPEAFDKISKTRMFNKSPEALERFKKHVWGKGEPSGPVIEMGEGKEKSTTKKEHPLQGLATDIKKSKAKLEKMHTAYMEKMHSGNMSRATTTTYNARAGQESERVDSVRKRLSKEIRTAWENGEIVPDDIVEVAGNAVEYVDGKYSPIEKPTPAPKIKPQADKRPEQFRKLAEGLQGQIDEKRSPAIGQQNLTARRARISAGMAKDADNLEKRQHVLNGMAADIENGTLPDSLQGIKTKAQIDQILWKTRFSPPDFHRSYLSDLKASIKGIKGLTEAREIINGLYPSDENRVTLRTDEEIRAVEKALSKSRAFSGKKYIKDDLAEGKRLIVAGIKNQADLDQAKKDMEQYIEGPSPEALKKQKLKNLERDLIGVKIPGFFPTPKKSIEHMLDLADIQPGMKVLEPSAGKGDIADMIKEKHPEAKLDVVEYSGTLTPILEAKGYELAGRDFLEHQGEYDRIVMNPPFENFQDIDHVQHAYELLRPAGRVVSIMGEAPFFRSDKKAVEFREWLEEVGGTVGETARKFKGAESFRQTGVATRIVTIDKARIEPEPPTEAKADRDITATYTFKAGTNFTDTKKMALATIDDAIKAAKKEEDPQGFVRFKDPESGARFDVMNNPGTLLDFRKNYSARMTTTGMSGKPPTRKGASTKPGKPKESWDLKKMMDFKNGWISDGAIVIKSKLPTGKIMLDPNVRLEAFKTVEDMITSKNLKPAELRYYTTTDPDVGEAIGKERIVRLGDEKSHVVFKAGKKRYPYDVEKFNIITNRYPDATFKIGAGDYGDPLVAYDDGEPVAVLMTTVFKGQKDVPGIKWAAKKGFADTGGYAEISAIVEMPELIQLFTKVTKGEYPRIKKHLGGLRIGQFRPMSGKIELKADIFKDPATALKVLAHEIGHWIDWLPDKDIRRGNILGRIASIKRYMTHWLDDILGGPGRLTDVEKKRLKEEAKKLEAGEKWIDEEIKRLLPIKPQDILDIWNAMIDPSAMNPALYEYVQRLSTADKKSIVKEAMKGQVRKDLEQFAQIVKTKTGKKVLVKIKASDQEVLDRYKSLIEEEIARRNIYNRDEIMDELKKFTHLWKPFDVHADPAFTKYRYSSVELYADAVSGIMVNPNLFRMVAPKFWDAWNTWLHRKPEVMTAYRDAQKLIRSGSVEVTKRRMDDIYDMFYRGDMARLEARRESDGKAVSAYDAVSTYLWDKNHSALKVIRRLEKDTGLIGDHAKNTRWMLEELNYLANDANIYLSDIYSNVLDPLTVDGFHPKELGLVLFQRRILGDRSEIGNPLGHSPQTVSVDMENIERHIWGPEKTKRIHHFADALRALRENQLFPLLEESGLVTPEFMKVIADTQDYATFSNVEWFKTKYGKGPGAAFYRQIGTLGEIENPLVSVILKDVSLMRGAHINMTKRELLIDLAYAGALQPANLRWSKDVGLKGGRVPVEPTEPMKSLFSVLVEGKADHYYISKKIADTFKFAPVEAQQLGIIWRYLSQPIREVLVSKNPIWMARNVIRDFRQTIKNIPEVKLRHVPRLSVFYAKAFRETYKDIFKGERSDDIRQLLEIKGIPVNRIWTGKEETFDMEIDRMAEEFQLSAIADRQAPTVKKKLKKLWDGLDKVGRMSDIWGKVAGFKYLKAHSERPIRGIAHVTRSRIGTPDYRRIGSGQEATNNLCLFSNVGKEGIRAAIESFREDPGGYIWKTIATNMLPKFIIAVLGAGVPIYFLKRMSDANDEDENVKRIKYLQRIIEGISEYDKSHYTNIPLGLTTKGKSVYLRIPEDYEGQFWGALAHKLINLKITGQDGLLRLIAEQSPYHFHPIITATSRLIGYYLMGQNPVDPYRGRYIMPDDVYKAGGAEAHRAMAKDVWKELGGSLIYRPAWDGLELDRAEWEKRLQKFPLNIVGTFVKISDRGITEKLEARIQEIRQQEAKETLRTNRAFIRLVNGEELTPEDALLTLEGKNSEKRKKLLGLIGKKYGGAYVRQLARPLSNEEKIAVVNIMLKDVPN